MTVVVLGIDALDPELVDSTQQENLVLNSHKSIETIESSSGEPSTHELWPSIITGLTPEEHGLKLDGGVAWESPVLRWGSEVAEYVLPDTLQSSIGAWILNSTEQDAFRESADYYERNELETIFDGHESKAIGVPNYVIDPNDKDREHELRKDMGEMFERDGEAKGGHRSADPFSFYELCMEMTMVRIARARRSLRSRRYELVFGYTSGLDLIGHVSYDIPELQEQAYDELDDFVGELREDLEDDDVLLLVSDHGLQDGVHTHKAMVSGTDTRTVNQIDSVLDINDAINQEIRSGEHTPREREVVRSGSGGTQNEVKEQLEDLGYI
ncbi:hypothetical protein HKK80_01205 [Halonotius sp. F2-221B]|uniref:alkaline phosphatase family protein n=1 Tax=Halonotius sp. F2-221B TaxID=2731620 RepID=UPI00398A8BA4